MAFFQRLFIVMCAIIIMEVNPISYLLARSLFESLNEVTIPAVIGEEHPVLGKFSIWMLIALICVTNVLVYGGKPRYMLNMFVAVSFCYALIGNSLPEFMTSVPVLILMKACQLFMLVAFTKVLCDEDENHLHRFINSENRRPTEQKRLIEFKMFFHKKWKSPIEKRAYELSSGVESSHYQLTVDQEELLVALKDLIRGHMYGELKPLHMPFDNKIVKYSDMSKSKDDNYADDQRFNGQQLKIVEEL